jgi:hypothetical protein
MHEFTLTTGLLSGYNYPNCGTSRTGYYSGPPTVGSITNSTFKIYTINNVYSESQYENDDGNSQCLLIANQYGHSYYSFVFSLSGYSGAQLGAFRKIVDPTNVEYSALDASYYASGLWAWEILSSSDITSGTYKIYY